MSASIAAEATQKIAQRGTKTYLPWLALFLGPLPSPPLPLLYQLTSPPGAAGAYTYTCVREEGNAIDRVRSRFLKAKEANDLRITRGAGIQHEDDRAARLPESYHGFGDLGLWSDKARFSVERVARWEPNPVRRE